MLQFFNTKTNIQDVNFQDVQKIINNSSEYILINTLPENMQSCLILNTKHINEETTIINNLMDNYRYSNKIVLYGKNCCDPSVDLKSKQLINLGFRNVYVYRGGLFEWLLLQDIYSEKNFQTTSETLDILMYKPDKIL